MILIKPSFSIQGFNPLVMLQRIETVGHTCYKSEDKITNDSAREFVHKIITRGHESVLEHEKVTVRVVCDRGVTHEIVRHRIASYSQESTRYCNYRGGVTFVIPPWVDVESGEYPGPGSIDNMAGEAPCARWMSLCYAAEQAYVALLEYGWSPQQARSVLPNSLKTELVMTMNLREWRHFFKLRTSRAAHPQMRELACPMLRSFNELVPVVFNDLI